MTEMEIDPRVEKIVWRALGVKSVRQIAEETGLAPEQIFAIKREMLDAVDVLSVQEKKQKLLVTLEEIAQTTQEDYANAPWEFKSGLANSAIASMKTIMVELNRTSKEDQGRIEQLNQLRIRELLRLVDTTVARTFAEISEAHGIDQDELLAVFQSHLKPAAEELED